jgi:hypothetical protein
LERHDAAYAADDAAFAGMKDDIAAAAMRLSRREQERPSSFILHSS